MIEALTWPSSLGGWGECAMKSDLAELRARVLDVIRDTALGERVRQAHLEADFDTEGTDFLRVILETESLKGLSNADLLAMIARIEDALGGLDDRFASVRLVDADAE